ncbi:MAG TPA: hypothetical protein DCM05_15695 [Elusimicrobia bacterium]|nr:hypothetical protein [Elusimicrobiota bacterium]
MSALLLLLLALPACAGDPYAAQAAALDRMEAELSSRMEALVGLEQQLAAHKAAHPSECPGAQILEERRALLERIHRDLDDFSGSRQVYDHTRDQYAMASVALAGLSIRKGRKPSFGGAALLQQRMEFGNETRAFGERVYEVLVAEKGVHKKALEACRRSRLLRLASVLAAVLLAAALGIVSWRLLKAVPAGP